MAAISFIILILWTCICIGVFGWSKNGISDYGWLHPFQRTNPLCKVTSLKYSHIVILKFNICRYGHILLLQATAKTEIHCKPRGNITLCVEQKRAQASQDTALVSQPGKCCGNPVAQSLCCLKTLFRNQNYLLPVLMVSQNHPLQIQLSFWAAAKPGIGPSFSTFDAGTSFY